MGIGSILLAIALLFLVALFVGRPFLQGQPGRQETMTELEALQAQKEALLEQIRILDFEHDTGKMPGEEHAQQRAQLLQEAAAVLKALDKLAPDPVTNGSATRVEREVEAAIAAMRRVPHATPPEGETESQIEAAVQSMRHQVQQPNGPQAAGRFCSQCGNPREPGDKFCAYCGFGFA